MMRHIIRQKRFLSLFLNFPARITHNCHYYKISNPIGFRAISTTKFLKFSDADSTNPKDVKNVKETVLDEIKTIANNVEKVDLSANLSDLTHVDDRKWDFLDTIELIVKLEEKFGVSLNDTVCNSITTLKDIVDSFENELNKNNS